MRSLFSLLLILCCSISLNAQVVQSGANINRASDPNLQLAKALKTSGTVTLAVGVPCLAVGVASLLYANLLPNPVSGYTTSMAQAEAQGRTYITTEEYNAKLRSFNSKTHVAEVAGYVMTPAGIALTITGIPLYIAGNKMLKVNLQVSGNGAGVAINF